MTLLRPYLPDGVRIEEALAQPETAGARFMQRHARLTDLQWLLENIKPGVAVRFPSEWDENAEISRVIVGVQPPRHGSMFDTPAAYRMKTISAGDSTPQVTSLSRIIRIDTQRIVFSQGVADGPNETFMQRFDEQAMLTRALPVQILTGNILAAMQEARRHDLGTVSLYRDSEARVHRGIVIARHKVDLSNLPVDVPSTDVLTEAVRRFIEQPQPDNAMMRLYLSMDPTKRPERSMEEDGIIHIAPNRAVIDFIALRRSNYAFFASRTGLYETLYDAPLPDRDSVRSRVARNSNHKPLRLDLSDAGHREKLFHFLSLLDDPPMIANGTSRAVLNEASNLISRIRDGYVRADRPIEEGGAAARDAVPAAEAGAEDDVDDIDVENITFDM